MQKINEGIVFICAFCGWLYWFRRIMIVWLSCRKLKWRINQNTNYCWKTKVGSIVDFGFDIDTGQNSFKYDFNIFDIDFIPVVDITAKHLAVGWGITLPKIYPCCSFLIAFDSCHYNDIQQKNVSSHYIQCLYFVPSVTSKFIPYRRCPLPLDIVHSLLRLQDSFVVKLFVTINSSKAKSITDTDKFCY